MDTNDIEMCEVSCSGGLKQKELPTANQKQDLETGIRVDALQCVDTCNVF